MFIAAIVAVFILITVALACALDLFKAVNVGNESGAAILCAICSACITFLLVYYNVI